MNWKSVAVTLSAALLLFAAVVGPVYVFVFMSCVTTRSCHVGGLLSLVGAECDESNGAQTSTLLHGDICTVTCGDGLVPSSERMTCDDGHALGSSGLRCLPPEDPGTYDPAPQLNSQAVVNQELRVACLQAQDLECSAPVGGAEVLMVLDSTQIEANLGLEDCSAILEECRALNSAFAWMQHSGDDVTESVCTFGCFTPVPAYVTTTTTPEVVFVPLDPDPPAPEPCLDRGPACVAVNNSCNPEDNGDYFRWTTCIDDMPQWARLDRTRRIRFDGNMQFAQGGYWLLEMDMNPDGPGYGVPIGRQPTFEDLPFVGTFGWDYKCLNWLNSFTYYVSYRSVDLSLNECSCTDADDCSSHGVAIGSKDEGPNCFCECEDGWTGTHCEIRLCRAPQVLNAVFPACQEGELIFPGATCTPLCVPGYDTPVSELRCSENALFFTPTSFACNPTLLVADLGALAASQYVTATGPPPCSEVDCSFRGTPVNEERLPDGGCLCQCNEQFTGSSCELWSGNCITPLPNTVENGHTRSLCLEGSVVESVCTAQCADGFWPIPTQLECTGEEFEPATFRCLGGVSVREQWCSMMESVAFGVSGAAFLTLILGFICQSEKVRETFFREKEAGGAVQVGNTLCDHIEDAENGGGFYIVRPEGREQGAALPERLQGRVAYPEQKIALSLQDDQARQHLALESPEATKRPRKTGDLKFAALANDSPPPQEAMAGTSSQLLALRSPHAASDAVAASGVLALTAGSALSAGSLAQTEARAPRVEDTRPIVNTEDLVFLRSHTGKFVDVEGDNVGARWDERCRLNTLTIRRLGGGGSDSAPIVAGCTVLLLDSRGKHICLEKRDSENVLMPRWPNEVKVDENQFTFEMLDTESPIVHSGDSFALRTNVKRHLNVEGEAVQARWNGDIEGPREKQQFIIEKPMDTALAVVGDQDKRSFVTSGLAGLQEATRRGGDWHATFRGKEDTMDANRGVEFERLRLRNDANALAESEKMAAIMDETADERGDAEEAIEEALRTGDAEALRTWIPRAQAVLEIVKGAPANDISGLQRLLLTADARLKQFDNRSERRAGAKAHDQRVQTGSAADWSMTQDELWTHVERGHVGPVRAGLRAKLLVSARTSDGQRLTLLHVACRRACLPDTDDETVSNILGVVQALTKARGNPNTVDIHDRTPLDLAVCEGGPEASASHAYGQLRDLGLRTASEAIEAAAAEAAAKQAEAAKTGSRPGR